MDGNFYGVQWEFQKGLHSDLHDLSFIGTVWRL